MFLETNPLIDVEWADSYHYGMSTLIVIFITIGIGMDWIYRLFNIAMENPL